MNGYTIRPTDASELESWWALRLRALKDHPAAFGSDYETSLAQGPTYAERDYFNDGANALFGAFSEDARLIGQAATTREVGKRAHIAHVISVYVHPEHRGHQIGTRLVQSAIEHLRTFPEITSIRISVNSSNVPARTAYERLGFEAWGEEPDAIALSDGSLHAELHMVLRAG